MNPVASSGIRVLVVDDDPVARSAVRSVVEQDPRVHRVHEAGDGRAALRTIRSERVDVTFLDLRMPVLDGISTLEVVRREKHATRVVILTTFGDRDFVRRAIEIGVDGFLLKSGDPRDLLGALGAASSGEAWLSPRIARLVTTDLQRVTHQTARAAERFSVLTSREREVALLVAAGHTNGEIAEMLVLTESTIKAYVSAAIQRLGCRNRVGLAAAVWDSQREK